MTRWALVLFLAIGLATPAKLHAVDLEWSGSLKSLNLYGQEDERLGLPETLVTSNRLRLENRARFSDRALLETALDYQLLGTDPSGLFNPAEIWTNRRIDLEKTWQHSKTWSGQLQVDRFNLALTGERMDAVLGRQGIGFGRIVIVSPLDVIAPFPPDALDTDIRPGVDAARLSTYYGLDGQVAGTFIWGDQSDHNSALLTWADNRRGIDLLAIGGRLRNRPMIGAGLAGSLGPLGLKGELAVYEGQDTDRPDGDLHDSFAIGAVEGWYRFDNGLTLILEYLYNGPGVGSPASYPEALVSAPLREGLTYLLGRHYLLAGPSYELHPLATLNGLLLWNLEDDSWLLRPTLSLNLADNLSLELFWTCNQGLKPDRTVVGIPVLPRSEFGWRTDGGGLFIKYFF